MNLFPRETWKKIIFELDCQSILNIQLISLYFNDLCINNDLYMKRKMQGFPRTKGRCKEYNLGLDDLKEFQEIDFDKLEYNKIPDKIANIILAAEFDLVRGDVIVLSECCDSVIFDGHNFLNLPAYNVSLNQKFKVISI